MTDLSPADLAALAALLDDPVESADTFLDGDLTQPYKLLITFDQLRGLLAAATDLARLRAGPSDADLAELAREYAPAEVPRCPVCEAEMILDQRGLILVRTTEYVCPNHPTQTAIVRTDSGDPRILALVSALRVARERIAELEAKLEQDHRLRLIQGHWTPT